MKIIRSIKLMQETALDLRRKGKVAGLVPTMGALHEGHLSLISKARKDNDTVIVSIFVNPKQFGPSEDYLRYPRPFKNDKKLCERSGVDILFVPGAKEMYSDDHASYVNVEGLSDTLCGASRPGHFKGVATVVAKLFNITLPVKAYFGTKDLQQLRVIERFVKDLNIPVKIVECPILRERSGLALSSRNQYLTAQERSGSAKIYESLQYARNLITLKKCRNMTEIIKKAKKIILRIKNSRIDYFEIRDLHTLNPIRKVKLPIVILAAVWIGKTRLIDNIVIRNNLVGK
jgi:pantoate--beta-alanine ligase